MKLFLLHLAIGVASAFEVTKQEHFPAPQGGRIQDELWAAAYAKARALVAQMTLPEKVNLTTGGGWESGLCVGNANSVPRFGIPDVCLQDSPLGVRLTDLNTAFPAGIAAAASFNKNLFYERGQALGQEFRNKGADVALGPCVGPLGLKAAGGRGWEGFGADAYLAGIAAAETITGIQEQEVVATIKHLIGNEQEWFRQVDEALAIDYTVINETLTSNIHDRAMHETYLWPFYDAVHAGVGSVMCSYQRLNETHACQNSKLLNGLLKEELGFEGFVMSDWGAVHHGVDAVISGLDMLMPGDGIMGSGWSYYGANLTSMVLNQTVPIERVDDMATRILAAYFYVGIDFETSEKPNFSSFSLEDEGYLHLASGDYSPYGIINKHVNVMTNFTRNVAYETAVEGIILLKNPSNVLPLHDVNKISILGKGAEAGAGGIGDCSNSACADAAMAMGWGSGTSNFPWTMSPLEAIKREGRERLIQTNYYTGYNFSSTSFTNTARLSDINILFANTDAGEGFVVVNGETGDRSNYTLWQEGEMLIEAAVKLNKNNVVVISTVGPVNVEKWIEHENVTAVVLTLPLGQEMGIAISDVLFGKRDITGRLPFTIAKNDSDYVEVLTNLTEGIDFENPTDNFETDILIDYQLFEVKNASVRYEFGYGLSYTNWTICDSLQVTCLATPAEKLSSVAISDVYDYGDSSQATDLSAATKPADFVELPYFMYPWIDEDNTEFNDTEGYKYYPSSYSTEQPSNASINGGGIGGNPQLWDIVYNVTATVQNTGSRDGGFVAQLYVEFPCDAEIYKPKSLRGFEKVFLNAHEEACVTFPIKWRDLAVWDAISQQWIVQRGTYNFIVGSSSKQTSAISSICIE